MNRAVVFLLALAVVAGVGAIVYFMFEDSGGKTKAPAIEGPATTEKPAPPKPKEAPTAPITPKSGDPPPIKSTAFATTAGAHHEAGIGGIVVSADGAPLENATCELFEDTSAIKDRSQEGEFKDRKATTADGLFLFDRTSLSLSERYLLKVSHPMFVTERKTLDIRKPDSAIIQVTMRPGTAITGTVRTVRGDPVAGAEVVVYDMNQNTMDPSGSVETRVTTDPSGNYEVAHLAPGMKKIHASAAGYATAGKQAINVEAGRPLAGIDFALNEGGAISGQLVGTDGTPIQGAYVTARPVRIGPRAPEGVTQAVVTEQQKREAEVQDREQALSMEKERAEAELEPASDVQESKDAEREAIIKREALKRSGGGRPSDAEAAQRRIPAAQAPLVPAPPGMANIKRPAIPPHALLTNLSVRTQADGTFSIPGAEVGSYVVSVNAAGYMPPPQQTVETPALGVNFILQPNARIIGRVVDDETGKPVTMFTIGTTMNPDDVLIPAYSKKAFGPPKSVDGIFEYIDVRPGRMWLVADAPGYAGGRSGEIVVTQGERREGVEIRLVRGATIVGRVLDAKGSPIARATVQPEPASASGAAANPFLSVLTASMRRDIPETTTDSEGRFALPNMLSGAYTLNVKHPDFGPFGTAPFTVPASGEIAVPDIMLARGATIRGRVRLPDGTPDTKAMVQVSPIGGAPGLGAHRSAYTDSDGMFEVNGLAAGQYRVLVAQRNGQPDLSSLFSQLGKGAQAQNLYTLGEGETKELDL